MSGKAKTRKTFGSKLKDQQNDNKTFYNLANQGTVMSSSNSLITGGSVGGGTVNTFAESDLQMNTYDIVGVDRLKFAIREGSGDALTSDEYGIEALYSGNTAYGMQFRVPATKKFFWYSGSSTFNYSDTLGLVVSSSLENSATFDGLKTATMDFTLTSSPANPSSAIRLFADVDNSNHLTIRKSDGSEVDLETLPTGANQQLSNLSGTTDINKSLIPDSYTNNRTLGTSIDSWYNLWIQESVRFGENNSEDASIIYGSSKLKFNLGDSGDWYEFEINGSDKFKVGNTLSVIYTDLDPSADDTYELGQASYRWLNVWAKNLEDVDRIDFETTNTAINDSSGTLQHEANAGHTFVVSSTTKLSIGADYILIQPQASAPSTLTNGMIWHDTSSGDVFVRTGGTTKNMSNI